MSRTIKNLLTVDLEEWYVVESLTSNIDRQGWRELPSTLRANTARLLEIFARYQTRATWFVLGWCAEQYPDIVDEIIRCGHEVACHSYGHRRIDELTPEEFRKDTLRAMDAITRACGAVPRGYRAPSWSINDTVPWAFEILAELGFEYDSSLFPIKHDIYGQPDGPRQIYRMKFPNGKTLWEVPATTVRILGQNLPLLGGGYLRHAPWWYSRLMLRRLNRQNQPAIIYIHPWELDPSPPQLEGLGLIQRFRSTGSTGLVRQKLRLLLEEFEFSSVAEYIAELVRRPIGFEQLDTN